MSKIEDGRPAFPSVAMNDPGHPASIAGMSLRDYFAGQALAGIHASVNTAGRWPADALNSIARGAYAQADAMLAERAKATGKPTDAEGR